MSGIEIIKPVTRNSLVTRIRLVSIIILLILVGV